MVAYGAGIYTIPGVESELSRSLIQFPKKWHNFGPLAVFAQIRCPVVSHKEMGFLACAGSVLYFDFANSYSPSRPVTER